MKEIFYKLNWKNYFDRQRENITQLIIKLKNEYRYLIKIFFILFIIFTIAYYPIIRANFNYQDDQGRILLGYKEWENYSRYTSYYLSSFIHTSNYLTDISPLTQIIATIFLASSGTIIIYLFEKEKKINYFNILAVTPLGLCPYFLACLSYKFDSPYMALSILSSIIPFIFYKDEKAKTINFKFFIAVFLGTLVMCTTYQAASGIIPILAIFLALKLWNNKENRESILLLITSAIAYIFGIIFFKEFIMVPDMQSAILPLERLIPGFFENLKIFYMTMIEDFRTIWLFLIIALIISFIIVTTKYSKQRKILAIISSIVALILAVFLVFGVYPAFTYTFTVARAMYGIGVFIAIIGVNTTNIKKMYINKIIALALSYCFITFACIYGNALSEQKRYVDFRVQSVVDSLSEMDIMQTNDIKKVKIIGSADFAPSITNMPSKYKNLIIKLSGQTFSEIYTWNQYYFNHYFKIKNILLINDEVNIPNDLEIVKDTMYYTISTNSKDYIQINIK